MDLRFYFKRASAALTMALESFYFVPVVFLFAFFCWFFKLPLLVVYVFCALFVLILVFCSDVKNIFALVLYVSFFITDIVSEPHWGGYAVAISFAVLAIVYCLVKNIRRAEKKIERGKMFVPLIVSAAGLCLGGLFGRFDFLAFIVTLGFCAVTYLLYFIGLNFTENLKKYLSFLFVIGAAALSMQMLIVNTALGSIRPYPSGGFYSAQTVNTAAIFIVLGMAGCFGLGFGGKYDAAFMLLSVVYTVMTFITFCRTMIAVAVFTEVALYVLFIVYSEKPSAFMWANLVICAAVALCACFYGEIVKPVLDRLVLKNGLSGRDTLWSWCVKTFAEYPLFGYGFLCSEDVTAVRNGILLAHNTILQWLVSLGVVGTALMGYFYFYKYKILFTDFDKSKLFTLFAVLIVALSGTFDQAAAMDFFVFLTPLVITAGAEGNVKKRVRPRDGKPPVTKR